MGQKDPWALVRSQKQLEGDLEVLLEEIEAWRDADRVGDEPEA